MIAGKNKSNILTKDISCKCKYKFDGMKCNSNRWWNKCQYECKNHHICEKDYIWNPATCSCKNGKYVAGIQSLRVVKLLKKKQKHLQQILIRKI